MVPLGDSAVVVKLGREMSLETHNKVRQLAVYLEQHPFDGMVEYVPAFTTVTVYYDGMRLIELEEHLNMAQTDELRTPYSIVVQIMEGIILQLEEAMLPQAKVVEVPVCYGGAFGPDLDY